MLIIFVVQKFKTPLYKRAIEILLDDKECWIKSPEVGEVDFESDPEDEKKQWIMN